MIDDIEDIARNGAQDVAVRQSTVTSVYPSAANQQPSHYRNKKLLRQQKYGKKKKEQQEELTREQEDGLENEKDDYYPPSSVAINEQKKKKANEQDTKQQQQTDSSTSAALPKGHLPGRGKVFLRTWGCSHNNSDGEYMAGQLVSEGFELTSNKAEADVWILNSCTVKNPSQDTFINAIKDGQDVYEVPVVVTGCVPQGERNHKAWKDLSMIGVQQIDRVTEVVEQAINGNVIQIMDQTKTGGAKLNLPKIRKNELIEIIPINTGCLNQCTYCKTKHARGNLRSYPPSEILARVDQVLQQGIKEIWLTSEDTGTYGRDIGHSLPDLLWRIAEKLPVGVMLRVGMTNPPYILEYLEELVYVFRHPRVYAFLHVPVQSGSNRVLEDMRREYTCQQFEKVVDFLRQHVPDMTIGTDVICGFPTETNDDWSDTMDLVRAKQFPILYISQFYPRQGTPAARMPRVSTKEVKSRSRALTTLFDSYTTREHMLHKEYNVLVTETATDKKNLVGHTKSYDQVILDPNECEKGQYVRVRIIEVGKHFCRGEVLHTVVTTEEDEMNMVQLKQDFYQAAEIRIQRGIRGEDVKTQEKLENLARPSSSTSISKEQDDATIAAMDQSFHVFSTRFLQLIILVTMAAILVAWINKDRDS